MFNSSFLPCRAICGRRHHPCLRLIAALAHRVERVSAVTHGTVHAEYAALVVRTLGVAHRRRCNNEIHNSSGLA